MASSPGLAHGIAIVHRRVPSREVAIGDVRIGAGRPIAIQSMTNTFTHDAEATARQIVELARAGCEIVRVTVPAKPDAEALPEIRRLVREEGVSVPLVADVHFSPKIALAVVEQVEKVRINPGNYADKRDLKGRGYDESRFERDRERARELFVPLVDRAREVGVAMRIGVNHGSLSDRLVERHGDSPEGMVASAIEFIEFAEDRGYRDIVVSMKSSIPQVMVAAYRLLARRLLERGELYPLHLGVTEAGGGDDGRIKSAAGIATLLAEGLGDTIRVSLTEDPVAEVPVASELAASFARSEGEERRLDEIRVEADDRISERRPSAGFACGPIAYGGDEVPRVELEVDALDAGRLADLAGLAPPVELVDVVVEDAADWRSLVALANVPERAVAAIGASPSRAGLAALDDAALFGEVKAACDRLTLTVDPDTDDPAALVRRMAPLPLLLRLDVGGPIEDEAARIVAFARSLAGAGVGLSAALRIRRADDFVAAHRLLASALDQAGCRAGIVIADAPRGAEDPRLGLAGRISPLLLDGLGIAVRLVAGAEAGRRSDIAHRILQASRRRLERAEFIACPSCGRTLFELESTTERIRELTGHLKLKIAVMGCIVNGPGEMADADYGYVGWGPGKVALFVGREMVAKDIPTAEAADRLICLIRERGDWIEP